MQMLKIMENTKSVVITGHSIGGTTAAFCTLWLLSYLHSVTSTTSVLCITFGAPLVGNKSLYKAILCQRWGGNFCHVVSKHDMVPRMFFAPLALFNSQRHSLLQFRQLSMAPLYFELLAPKLPDQSKAQIFQIVLASSEGLAHTEECTKTDCGFSPYGNYVFCSEDGAICIENAISVIKLMHLFMSSSSSCSIDYGDYVGKVSLQFLKKRGFLPAGELPESSYEASVTFALQSSGIACQEPVAQTAKDCLKLARRMGRTPNLNCANLAIKLSKITPYRAEIEWYKTSCDQSKDQLGYYDSFKQREASKRDSKVNMNRHKLAHFWDNVINMLENNQLPIDFHKRAKWVNASQFYKLLVEPLDIAEYYRTGMHHIKGHYTTHGRERRYQIFDKWWKERPIKEEEKNKRSKFASLTQDTCFWANAEEAREWLDNMRSEKEPRNLPLLWDKIDKFERYASELVDRKEVSKDVIAKNSSYSLWVKHYKELKSQVGQWHP